MDEWFVVEVSSWMGLLRERVAIQGRRAVGKFICDNVKIIEDSSKSRLRLFLEGTRHTDPADYYVITICGGGFGNNSARIYQMTSAPRFDHG